MAHSKMVSGEVLDHKLAAIFDTEADARTSADKVLEDTSLSDDQVFIVRWGDKHPGWELEPEDRGIWRTLVRSHISLGLAGVAVGIVVFLALVISGVSFVVNNALASSALIVALCATLGLMLGGLVTLRPDHVPYIVTAQSALREGKTVLAVHAKGRDQLEEAQKKLKTLNVKTVASL